MAQRTSRWWLVRAWQQSRSFSVFVLILILGQAWAARDGVIRFPFVHWWMYAQPFPVPDSIDLVWLATPEGPLDPSALGGWQARHAVIGLLENQLPRFAGEGYGDAAAQAWMTQRVGPAMDRYLPAQAAGQWQARILPPTPDSAAWTAWLTRLTAAQLPAKTRIWPTTYRVHLQPESANRWAPVEMASSYFFAPQRSTHTPVP